MATIGLIMKYHFATGNFEIADEKGNKKQQGSILPGQIIAIDEQANFIIFYNKESGKCKVYDCTSSPIIIFNSNIELGWTDIVCLKNVE